MGIEIIIYEKTSSEISEIVRSLKDRGLRTGIDFDFEFSTGKYDWSTNENIPRMTKFTFYNEKQATWFALRWL